MFTQSLEKNIKKKNKLFYLSRNTHIEDNTTVYKTYKNKLTTILRKSERDYFCSELESNKDDLKNQWRILKNITGIKLNQPKHSELIVYEEKTITDLTEIAEIFNNHFINIGTNLRKTIKPSCTNPLNYLSSTLNSILVPQFSQNDIRNCIIALKSSSTGYDNIPTIIGKQLMNLYIEPLHHLMNLLPTHFNSFFLF